VLNNGDGTLQSVAIYDPAFDGAYDVAIAGRKRRREPGHGGPMAW